MVITTVDMKNKNLKIEGRKIRNPYHFEAGCILTDSEPMPWAFFLIFRDILLLPPSSSASFFVALSLKYLFLLKKKLLYIHRMKKLWLDTYYVSTYKLMNLHNKLH